MKKIGVGDACVVIEWKRNKFRSIGLNNIELEPLSAKKCKKCKIIVWLLDLTSITVGYYRKFFFERIISILLNEGVDGIYRVKKISFF